MRFLDYFRIAFKNLSRRKLRSFLTIIAVVIGALSLVIMLSLVLGAKRVFIQQMESIGALSLVTVSGNPNMDSGGNLFNSNTGDTSDSKKLDDTLATQLKTIPHVTGATPIAGVWARTMKLEGSEKQMWPNVIAYEPGTEVFKMPLLAGRTLTATDMDKIVVGGRVLSYYGYADKPEALLGKKIIFLFEGNSYNDWTGDPPLPPDNASDDYWKEQQKKMLEVTAEIVGVTSSSEEDGSFITMSWARKLMTTKNWQSDEAKRRLLDRERQAMEQRGQRFEYPPNSELMMLVKTDNFAEHGYSSIMLKTDATDNVESVANAVTKMGYGATTAKEMIDQISKLFLILGLILGTIGGISLFVASIGIINTMVMAMYERTHEIGVMRACGATRATVRRLFTFEAATLGFCGGLIGLLLSYVLAVAGNSIAGNLADTYNIPISGLIQFPVWLVLSVISFTTFTGLVAGLYPAIRASRLNPVEALRYE